MKKASRKNKVIRLARNKNYIYDFNMSNSFIKRVLNNKDNPPLVNQSRWDPCLLKAGLITRKLTATLYTYFNDMDE